MSRLREEAEELLSSGANPDDVVRELMKRAAGDEELSRDARDSGIRLEVREAGRAIRDRIRNTIRSGFNPEGMERASRRIAGSLSAIAKLSWYSYPLPIRGGVLLGNAILQDLVAAQGMYEKMQASCMREARFFAKLAEHVEEGVTVKAALSEDAIQAIRDASK